MSLQVRTGVPQYLNKESRASPVMVATMFIQKVPSADRGKTMIIRQA